MLLRVFEKQSSHYIEIASPPRRLSLGARNDRMKFMAELTKHEPTTIYIKPSKGLAALNLRDLWTYRELVYFMVWRDVKVKYKQTLLGMAWAIVQPVMTMIVFTFVFDKVAKLPTDGIPYPVFSFTGLLPWGLFATALNQGSRSLVMHNNMVTKIYFPRLILPMSAVFSGLVDFFISFLILIGTTLIADAFGVHVPKGYIYAAMGFSIFVEALNMAHRRRAKPVHLRQAYAEMADNPSSPPK